MLFQLVENILNYTNVRYNDNDSLSYLKTAIHNELDRHIHLFQRNCKKISYDIITKATNNNKGKSDNISFSVQIIPKNDYTHQFFTDIDVLEEFKKL